MSNGQNMPVSGFGNGNGFLFPDFPIKKFEYSYLTGILTFTTGYIGLLSFTIPVGKGYNDTLLKSLLTITSRENIIKTTF